MGVNSEIRSWFCLATISWCGVFPAQLISMIVIIKINDIFKKSIFIMFSSQMIPYLFASNLFNASCESPAATLHFCKTPHWLNSHCGNMFFLCHPSCRSYSLQSLWPGRLYNSIYSARQAFRSCSCVLQIQARFQNILYMCPLFFRFCKLILTNRFQNIPLPVHPFPRSGS